MEVNDLQNENFRPINPYISETIENRHIVTQVTIEDYYEVAYWISICASFDGSERP